MVSVGPTLREEGKGKLNLVSLIFHVRKTENICFQCVVCATYGQWATEK